MLHFNFQKNTKKCVGYHVSADLVSASLELPKLPSYLFPPLAPTRVTWIIVIIVLSFRFEV